MKPLETEPEDPALMDMMETHIKVLDAGGDLTYKDVKNLKHIGERAIEFDCVGSHIELVGMKVQITTTKK